MYPRDQIISVTGSDASLAPSQPTWLSAGISPLLKPHGNPHPPTMRSQALNQPPGRLRVKQRNYILIIVLQHRIYNY